MKAVPCHPLAIVEITRLRGEGAVFVERDDRVHFRNCRMTHHRFIGVQRIALPPCGALGVEPRRREVVIDNVA